MALLSSCIHCKRDLMKAVGRVVHCYLPNIQTTDRKGQTGKVHFVIK